MSLLSKFTLAVPVYNDARHLRQCLDSCIHQAGTVWLYDNGSTDGSSDICAEYAEKHAHVTHIRHPQNLGAVENFRQPLFACTTPYFMWLGAHDYISEGHALPLLELLEADPQAVLAASDIQHMDEDGVFLKKFTRLGDWSADIQSDAPLKRMLTFVEEHFCGKRKGGSYLMHGIFRTKTLQKIWIEEPCLGFDDAILTRACGLGKLVYSPKGTLYIRWFTKSRPKSGEKERQAKSLTEAKQETVERSMRVALLEIIRTASEVTTNQSQLPDFFHLIRRLDETITQPKKARRKRRLKKLLPLILGLAALAVYFAINL